MREGSYPRLPWEDGLEEWPPIPAFDSSTLSIPGSGTEEDPYQINSPEHFFYLSKYAIFTTAHLLLTADLDLEDQRFYALGEGDGFRGVFDGGGHVLRNGTILIADSANAGLFSVLGEGGVIRNLGVENLAVLGSSIVGGLVAKNDKGTISNCYTTGSVTGEGDENTCVGALVGWNIEGDITDSYATGKVSSTGMAGGLVGSNADGILRDCYAAGDVTGQKTYAGGLAGFSTSAGTVSNCHASGVVRGERYAGGLLGGNTGPVTDCYATGGAIGTWGVGGLIGGNGGSGTVLDCYAIGTIYGGDNVGGLIGENYGDVSSCYFSGKVGGSDFTGGLIGSNEDGDISNCYASGLVYGYFYPAGLVGFNSGGTIYSCLSTAEVRVLDAFGGALVALNGSDGTITDSYWDMDRAVWPFSEGGEPRSTEELTYPYAEDVYADWDFTNLWHHDEDGTKNDGYPYLQTVAPILWQGEEEPAEGEPSHEGEGGVEGEPSHEGEGGVEGEPSHEGEGGVEGEPSHEGEGGVEGEPSHEGEGGVEGEGESPDESCGCCKSSDEKMGWPTLIQKGLGDWLLIGVSLLGLGIITRASH
ncbi:MAG: GLUG motif-containing protein [Candidatus Hydrogenedentales bacterium]|jgi:hypothetical protein